MDAKITMSFDSDIIAQAKQYAQEQGVSLSRLTEILFSKLTSGGYKSIDDFPVSNWVDMVSEGEMEYYSKPRSNKKLKAEYYKSKK